MAWCVGGGGSSTKAFHLKFLLNVYFSDDVGHQMINLFYSVKTICVKVHVLPNSYLNRPFATLAIHHPLFLLCARCPAVLLFLSVSNVLVH